MFYPYLVEAIDNYYKKIENNLSKLLLSEQWRSTRQWIYHDKTDDSTGTATSAQLTESAKYLYTAAQQFVNNITKILSFELIPCVSFTLCSLFETYILQLSYQMSRELSDSQSVAILANSHYVVEDLVPRLIKQLERVLNKGVREFEKLQKKLDAIHYKLQSSFCNKYAENEDVLKAGEPFYKQRHLEL